MIKLRRDRTGTVFTNAKGVPLTAEQWDVNEPDEDITRLCDIARQHLSSKTKAMAAMLQAEPKLFGTAGNAARICGVTPNTVRKWAADGKIVGAEKRDGTWRFDLAEIQRLRNSEELTWLDGTNR